MPTGPSDTPPNTDEGSTSPSSTRRAFTKALQNMRDESWKGGKAAVHSRSLLGEQIPDDIVREFRRWVEQNTEDSGGDQGVKNE